MTDNKKLNDLIEEVIDTGVTVQGLADYLVANGVTVHEWIPMTERRPTAEDANSDGVVLVRWKNADSTDTQYVDSPIMMHSSDLFSHWMHCPEPPKDGEV